MKKILPLLFLSISTSVFSQDVNNMTDIALNGAAFGAMKGLMKVFIIVILFVAWYLGASFFKSVFFNKSSINNANQPSENINKVDNQSGVIKNEIYSDEKYYSIALKELELNNVSTGLWGKAVAYGDGNQDKAKSYYLKERANQLMQMHQEKLNQSKEIIAPIIVLHGNPIITPRKAFYALLLLIVVMAVFNTLFNSNENSLESVNANSETPNYHGKVDDINEDKKLQMKAEQVDGDAQLSIGLRYFYGISVEKDFHKAAEGFRKAAEQGNAEGQGRLGGMYLQGIFFEKNPQKAAEWLLKAAEQGNAEGQAQLGSMYLEGVFFDKDSQKAVEFFRQAAQQNHMWAQFMMASMYSYGEGVARDYNQAAYWTRKAADNGNAISQADLGSIYASGRGVTQDLNQSAYWFRRAADQGNSQAQFSLGVMFDSGVGVTQDSNQAVYWYRKAAAQDHAGAMAELKKRGIR